MVYRQNILLAILEVFDQELSATFFQKILFLFSENQINRNFDFVPYKFGCFSFQAMADKSKLIRDGYLENTKGWKKANSDHPPFLSKLNETDRKILTKIQNQFADYSIDELIRYIYIKYPYYAIYSEIASKYLTFQELESIQSLKPSNPHKSLMTIGYEGKSLEQFLNDLIQKNVRVLCDVRKNPLSRKYGFAKKTLRNACESVQIMYLHLPELGIPSKKRQNLKNQMDYDILFLEYENTILNEQKPKIHFLHTLLSNYKRIALTCYEASPKQCHRTRVANAIHEIDNEIPVCHL
ncbi:DUF488 family protein [candidate division KSB1 bacterium]|nr:DUF488 family protein [candidate division KSB1 bacterium]